MSPESAISPLRYRCVRMSDLNLILGGNLKAIRQSNPRGQNATGASAKPTSVEAAKRPNQYPWLSPRTNQRFTNHRQCNSAIRLTTA